MTDTCTEPKGHFDVGSFVFGCLMGAAVAAVLIGILIACEEQARDVRKEAVEHHHARWVSDSEGRTHFEWIEPWEGK